MKKEIDFLKPEIISKLSTMELRAKMVVEGFLAGLHKSPFHGFSVEFAEFRQYLPGDEIKKLDWKAYAKTGKFYIKKFEDETNLISNLIIDNSASMGFASGGISKLRYASYIASAISYLSIKQRDAVGITFIDEKINFSLKPVATNSQLKRILTELENIKPSNETNLANILHNLTDKLNRKGLVIILSDLLDEENKMINALKHLRFNKHEVVVFHILDPVELDFTFSGDLNFIDMENKKNLKTNAFQIKKSYKNELNRFINFYKKECLNQNIDYVLLNTKTPFDISLTKYLDKRSRLI